MLRSAFDLPFAVAHPSLPFFSKGGEVTVVAQLRDRSSLEAARRVAEVMHLFVRFANLGGFAGRSVEPWRSGAVSHSPVRARDGEMAFRLERCRFDDGALIALCDLFLHKRNVALLRSIEVHTDGSNQNLVCERNSYSTYPERFAKVPFEVIDEEPESGAYTFALTMESELDQANREVLQGALDAWVGFILAGGFALAPIPPEENYVEPDDPFVEFDSSIEWSVFKLCAHPASIDALINIISAFHGRQHRVIALTIT